MISKCDIFLKTDLILQRVPWVTTNPRCRRLHTGAARVEIEQPVLMRKENQPMYLRFSCPIRHPTYCNIQTASQYEQPTCQRQLSVCPDQRSGSSPAAAPIRNEKHPLSRSYQVNCFRVKSIHTHSRYLFIVALEVFSASLPSVNHSPRRV